jgi:hypothetical protein
VNPKKIKVCSGNNDYWVVNDPKDIRPYGLCFKEEGKFPEVRLKDIKYMLPNLNHRRMSTMMIRRDFNIMNQGQ